MLVLLALPGLLGCSPCGGSGVACVIAGDGEHGFTEDGVRATNTRLYYPFDVVWSRASDTVYVVDWNNERVRHIDERGRITSVIGRDEPGDGDPAMGDRHDPGAPGTVVALNHPVQAEIAPDGRLYLAAWHNHKIRRYDPETGLVRVVVANHDQDTGNNGGYSGDGGPAEDAHVSFPSSVAFDRDGVMYVLDQQNLRVRRVVDGVIDTFAGTGAHGGDDGSADASSFRFTLPDTSGQPDPAGAVEVDDDRGVLWVADTYNGCLRSIDLATGEVSTLAVDGLVRPHDLELHPDGDLLVADAEAHRIWRVDPDSGAVDVFAGTGEPGFGPEGSPATEIALMHPMGVEVSDDGRVWIADTLSSRIWEVAP